MHNGNDDSVFCFGKYKWWWNISNFGNIMYIYMCLYTRVYVPVYFPEHVAFVDIILEPKLYTNKSLAEATVPGLDDIRRTSCVQYLPEEIISQVKSAKSHVLFMKVSLKNSFFVFLLFYILIPYNITLFSFTLFSCLKECFIFHMVLQYSHFI